MMRSKILDINRIRSIGSEHPLPFIFVALGLLTRLLFVFYTGRIWEDAYITLTPARNWWEGFGLTHHASEPYVHSFTSPISVLIPLFGESFGEGIPTLQVVSLIGFCVSIYYAYRIGLLLKFSKAAQILVLGYLAFDQLQVFFGMAGMETQVVVAIALANAYYLLSAQWWKLGFAAGAGLIGRPEFVYWLPIMGTAVLIYSWKSLWKVIVACLAVGSPWFIFATWYYGSPIPNTIVAKSLSWRLTFGYGGWFRVKQYIIEGWPSFAPFREMWFVEHAPVPNSILLGIVLIVVALALVGILAGLLRWNLRLLAVAAFVVAFLSYRAGSLLATYYMWYLPPFVALAFLMAGYGLTQLPKSVWKAGIALSSLLVFAYAVPTFLSMPIEKVVQRDIEEGVRGKVGETLNDLMGPNDTAVLEPLGYIGWFARNKTIYDFPGLGSKISVATLRDIESPSMQALAAALKPSYLAFRPGEFQAFEEGFPEDAAHYELVKAIRPPNGSPDLSFAGLKYFNPDSAFDVMRRTGE